MKRAVRSFFLLRSFRQAGLTALAPVVLFAFFTSGCGAGKNKTNVELIQDMMDQPSMKAQRYDEVRKEPSVRVPPDGTVPRGKEIYAFKGNPVEAEQKLRNPLAGLPDEKWMARGAEKYRIYCGVCHGKTGLGDGTVAPAMALKPPSLVAEKIQNYKDGRLYHIITDGQGVMGSYAAQIFEPNDRWAIVNYVRHLQKHPSGEQK
jgi:mono/diheme cytochrome c family protein